MLRSILRKSSVAKKIKEAVLFTIRRRYFALLRQYITPPDSVITNNCFEGKIPQDLGYPYNSPTAGLFFPYPDYIDFLSNISEAVKSEVKFRTESKHPAMRQYLQTVPWTVPVGYSEINGYDIEIIFLHYHTKEEALEKWQRRCGRVNFDRLVVFGSDNDGCTKEDVERFLKLPFERKFFFSAHDFGIPDSTEYCFVREMSKAGAINSYNRAHILYKYLCRLKLSKHIPPQ